MISMKKNFFLKILLAGLIFTAIYFFWEDLRVLDIQEFVLETENRIRGTIAITLLFAAKSIFFFLPAPLLYISAGMLLPSPLAFMLVCGGLFLDFSLTYFYGFMLGSDFVEKLLSKSRRLQKILSYNLENELKLAFTLRLMPVSLEAVSLLMGASGNKYWKFIAASLLGIAPKIMVYILIGNAIIYPVTTSSIILFISMLAAWAAAVTILKRNYVLEDKPSARQELQQK